MKYDIGAGRNRIDGWQRLDGDPAVSPDVLAMVPPLPETCRGAEAFRLIHVLEHFHQWEAVELLEQMHEFLLPGGRLVLELPNLQSAIDTLSGANGRRGDNWSMWVLYGDPTRRNPLFGHKWGWTPEALLAALVAAGFTDIERERPRYHVPDRDMRFVCIK
jgi:SAM-dependent methyltransferase